MTTKLIKDRSGKTIERTVINGRLFPPFSIESLNNTFSIKARPDDIVLCTFPKSGTHWTFEVIRLLLAGTTDLPTVEKDDTMMEFAKPSDLDDMSSPRILNTHYLFDNMSQDFFAQKCKIVYMVRDPRDAAASFFNHQALLSNYEGEWKDFFHLYLEGNMGYGSWFEYTKEWEKGMKEKPDHPFLVMSYEAMKKDPLKEVKRLADFLGVNESEDFLTQVVEKTSFNAMKAKRDADANFTKVMYRKGQVGDWKNWFTVAQSELFNQEFEKEMVGTDAYKLYSHTIHS